MYTTKMKAVQTAILRPERYKCAPVLNVRESVVTFHWYSLSISESIAYPPYDLENLENLTVVDTSSPYP